MQVWKNLKRRQNSRRVKIHRENTKCLEKQEHRTARNSETDKASLTTGRTCSTDCLRANFVEIVRDAHVTRMSHARRTYVTRTGFCP